MYYVSVIYVLDICKLGYEMFYIIIDWMKSLQ